MFMHRQPGNPSKRIWRKLCDFRHARDGVAAVEFALIVPVMLIILMGLLDYAIAVFHKMELESAVRSGAQYALVQDSNSATIIGVVEASTNLEIANVTVTVTESCECSDGSAIACAGTCLTDPVRHYTTVTANYIHTWFFLPGTQTLTQSITIRTQ